MAGTFLLTVSIASTDSKVELVVSPPAAVSYSSGIPSLSASAGRLLIVNTRVDKSVDVVSPPHADSKSSGIPSASLSENKSRDWSDKSESGFDELTELIIDSASAISSAGACPSS